jgi:hypothetical protein
MEAANVTEQDKPDDRMLIQVGIRIPAGLLRRIDEYARLNLPAWRVRNRADAVRELIVIGLEAKSKAAPPPPMGPSPPVESPWQPLFTRGHYTVSLYALHARPDARRVRVSLLWQPGYDGTPDGTGVAESLARALGGQWRHCDAAWHPYEHPTQEEYRTDFERIDPPAPPPKRPENVRKVQPHKPGKKKVHK